LIQRDGKIIVAGAFTSFNSLTRNCIVRLNTNGSEDLTFNAGTGIANPITNFITSVALQPNAKILVAGTFNSYNGNTRNYIMGLEFDGSIDTSFDALSLISTSVNTICLQNDGKIIVGGNFGSMSGCPRNGILRLLSNGLLDEPFYSSTGANGIVTASGIQTDGKILVGGIFTTINGILKNRITRLNIDGTIDTTFNVGTGTNSSIQSLAIQTDNKILIAGNFTNYNGTLINRLARLNVDGSLDTTFNTGSGTNNQIEIVTIQPDGKILIGGNFQSYNGTTRNRIARINTNGSLDLTFNPNTGPNNVVYAIEVLPNSKIILAGNFITYNGISCNRIVRISSAGTYDGFFNVGGTGADNAIKTLKVQPSGKILFGGDFLNYNGIASNRIARCNSNGTIDATFNPGTGANGSINSIQLQSNGNILIAGGFSSFNGTAINRIIRLDTAGTIDNTFNPGFGANGSIETMSLQLDEKIIIGGFFTCYDSIGRNRIARINNCLNSPNTILTQSACTSYTLNGQIYTQTGTFTQTLTNVKGCDSLITLNLTIRQPTARTITQSACSSYTLNGQTYTQSGTFTQTLTNSAGCDSTITLNLSINQPSISIITIAACSSYTLNGQTYNQSGNYNQNLTNATGCDSTITLNLTILQPSTSTLTQSACSSYTLNGQTFTQSGAYTQTLINATGCDSIITLNLTIRQSSSNIIQSACSFYTLNGQSYTQSGTYTQTLTNAAGCDSIITLNLNISNPPSNQVTLIGNTLSATQSGANYQWLDCNNNLSQISGATTQSFQPTTSGSYAVSITDAACSVISACTNLTIVGVNSQNIESIKIYPNPTKDLINISSSTNFIGKNYRIFDYTGKLLQNNTINTENTIISLADLTSGLYLLRIEGNNESYKIVKL
jgi:uncharacterized delta-60 repeat protein